MRQWVNKGGKLKVGGDVLVGLKRWETLVPKTPEVDKLLANMPEAAEVCQSLGLGRRELFFAAASRSWRPPCLRTRN